MYTLIGSYEWPAPVNFAQTGGKEGGGGGVPAP